MQRRYTEVSDVLETREYLLGDDVTLADFYCPVLIRSARRIEFSLTDFPGLQRLNDKLQERTAVQQALQQEGLETLI